MKTYRISDIKELRLSGRFPHDQEGFPMLWSASCAQMLLSASRLEVEIDCAYKTHKPYISFEVDGLRAQTFSPIPGKHWYNVFLNMDPSKKHSVRITKETQPFGDDASAKLSLLRIRTDGRFYPMEKPKRKIVFIGDSVTSGEGGRGPVSFMEWLPMCFCASDNYSRMTADKLKAQYEVVSQSGWGVCCGWDNNPNNNLPRIYEKICEPLSATQPGAGDNYDFSFDPDTVVIALGTNDHNAMHGAPYIDPLTGKSHQLTESSEDLARFENACASFLLRLRQLHPNARLVWLSYFTKGNVAQCVQNAIAAVKKQDIDVDYIAPFDFENYPRSGLGSRSHPGIESHKKISRALVKLLK